MVHHSFTHMSSPPQIWAKRVQPNHVYYLRIQAMRQPGKKLLQSRKNGSAQGSDMEGTVLCIHAQERFLVSVRHSAAKFQSGCKTTMAFDFPEMRTLHSLEERFELLVLASLQ